MLTDDDYDSIMGEILVPEEAEPIKPGTAICKTLNEGRPEEEDSKEEDELKEDDAPSITIENTITGKKD